ncbi:MAG: hypothetical protein JW891_11925 [Candidatus Lokiarchaeota archaeon]|nr:hypothetical protein [Candidatus Lokiarchaeota archaeon]
MKFEELHELFDSSTIKPSFDYIHIILALYLFGELGEEEGIGRYRLKEELLVGSGTVKSLITKLNKKIQFITVLSNRNQKKGHVLTKKGENFLSKIKNAIPVLKKGDLSQFKDIIIESKDVDAYICLVKNGSRNLTNGIAQRDAAIKINGSGATCLVYDGIKFTFPTRSPADSNMEQFDVGKPIQDYFKKELSNISLSKGDVLIMGLGDSPEKARLAALNAALTLI